MLLQTTRDLIRRKLAIHERGRCGQERVAVTDWSDGLAWHRAVRHELPGGGTQRVVAFAEGSPIGPKRVHALRASACVVR